MPNRLTESLLAIGGVFRVASLLPNRSSHRGHQNATYARSLHEATERYRTTFTLAPVGIAHVDREHRLITVNDLFCNLVGYSREELLGRSIDEMMHPAERAAGRQGIDDLIQGAVERIRRDRRYIRKDGSIAWAHINAAAVRDADGEVAYIIGIAEDVTAQRSAREKARMQSRILECIDQAVIATDSHGNISYWNAAAEELFGWSVTEVLGRRGRQFLCLASDEDIAEMGRHLRDGRGWNGEVLLQRRDGTRFPAFLTKAPVVNEDGTPGGTVAVVHDLSETKRVEHELRRHARQQEAMATLGKIALASLDRDAFDIACELLRFGAGADGALLLELVDGSDPTLRILGSDRPLTDGPGVFPLVHETACGVALATGETVVEGDTQDEVRFQPEPFVVSSALSRAIIPVASSTRTFGAIFVHSKESHHFSDSDVHFLQTAANMLAEAMEREAAWSLIEESERRYARIFEGSTEIIFTLDPRGRFLALNEAFETITGWSRDEYLGRPYSAVIVPEDRERIASLVDDLLSGRTQITEAEMTLVGRDGRIDVEVLSFAKVDDGRVTEIYGFARDVTQTRRETEERERVTRNLELLLASTVEGIFTLDNTGRCTMINNAAAHFLGTSPEALLGVNMYDVLERVSAPGSAASCSLSDILASAEPCVGTTEIFVAVSGRRVPVAYSAAPLFDEGTRVGTVVAFTDVSERRALEARLEQADRLASLGRLAATIAHEFNNVLMGISPFVEVVRRKPSPEKISMAVEHIGNAVQRGRRLTEEILRFTQPAKPVLVTIDIAPWLDRFAQELRSILPAQYEVIVESERLSLVADPNQLHQVLLNLALNSRDAMPNGGPIAFRARREPANARFAFGMVRSPERFVHLEIADAGAGMSPETLRHAFEPLFTTKRNGTGLGLAVAHQVVMRHRGEIFIESAEGEGTTFHIFLPVADESATTSEGPTVEPGGSGGDGF